MNLVRALTRRRVDNSLPHSVPVFTAGMMLESRSTDSVQRCCATGWLDRVIGTRYDARRHFQIRRFRQNFVKAYVAASGALALPTHRWKHIELAVRSRPHDCGTVIALNDTCPHNSARALLLNAAFALTGYVVGQPRKVSELVRDVLMARWAADVIAFQL